jgi:sterol-4alpha-carboxylate 3-dehydrogenase (decarboxylating)
VRRLRRLRRLRVCLFASVQSSLIGAGGAGFLGEHLVDALLATGKYNVTIFDLGPSATACCPAIAGDLRSVDAVAAACRGMDIVFHCATASPSTAGAASGRTLMTAVNVDGTRNVIEGCRTAGVRRLVFTSSASVVFAGKPLVDVDESCPYAAPPMDYYTGTKTEVRKGHTQGMRRDAGLQSVMVMLNRSRRAS